MDFFRVNKLQTTKNWKFQDDLEILELMYFIANLILREGFKILN